MFARYQQAQEYLEKAKETHNRIEVRHGGMAFGLMGY
jgi:hypothetical protein